jgi:hypothetical protein
MSDVKPKRTAREPGRSEFTPGRPAPAASTPIVPGAIEPAPIAAPAPTAAQAVSAPLEAVAQFAVDSVLATVDALGDSPGDSGSAGGSWIAVAEAQAALARGFEAIAVEMTGMTRSGIAAASDAAIALFGARTFSEIVEINAGFAQRGVDAMIESTARLSEIGARAVNEASRPTLSRPGGAGSSVHAD